MRCTRWHWAWLCLLVGVAWADGAKLHAQVGPYGIYPTLPMPMESNEAPGPAVLVPAAPTTPIPLNDVAEAVRERVRSVVEQPTISASGPMDEFIGQLVHYQWFLEHPDRAAQAWRRLGAPCLNITARGEDHFGWMDSHGNDVTWETVYRGPSMRIWYAEGKARPGMLFPPLPVRAVVVLYYRERRGLFGETHIQHHADLFVQTDSKTAALVLKVFGSSVPRLTDQCLGQFGLFFSGITHYVYNYPERAEALLK